MFTCFCGIGIDVPVIAFTPVFYFNGVFTARGVSLRQLLTDASLRKFLHLKFLYL